MSTILANFSITDKCRTEGQGIGGKPLESQLEKIFPIISPYFSREKFNGKSFLNERGIDGHVVDGGNAQDGATVAVVLVAEHQVEHGVHEQQASDGQHKTN